MKPNITEQDVASWIRSKGEELGVSLGVSDGEYCFNARVGGACGVGTTIAEAIKNANFHREKTREILRRQLAELDA